MTAAVSSVSFLRDCATAVPDLGEAPLDHALRLPALPPGVLVECGVYTGTSISKIANAYPSRRVYGFDSFQGLPSDWGRPDCSFPAGHFDMQRRTPAVPVNVDLRVGWFDETLAPFAAELARSKTPIALLHVDCDIYSSTKSVLEALGPFLVPGSVLVFDELFNYPTFEDHEFKALHEYLFPLPPLAARPFAWIGKHGAVIEKPLRDNGAWDQAAALRLL